MVYLFIREILLILTTWVLYIQTRHWARWRTFNKWRVANGYAEPAVVENKYPGGAERYYAILKGINGEFIRVRVWFS